VKACNYKNFSAELLNCARGEPRFRSTKSHERKFSTLWITPVDNTSDAIRRNNTADTRHHHTTQTTPCSYTPQLHRADTQHRCLRFLPRLCPGSYSALADADM